MKRALSLLLAALTAASLLAACGEAETAGSTAAETTAAAAESTAAAETEVTSGLPDLDYDGDTITFLNCVYFEDEGYILNADEATGDVVNDAVYQRNLDVMNDLNVTFEFIDRCRYTDSEIGSSIKNAVFAGADDYDIIAGVQFDIVQILLDGCFVNLSGAAYLDLDADWWATDYINEMSIGDKSLYFVTGDITLGMIRNMSCAYYNKQLWESLYGDPDVMYQTVADGLWTHEKLTQVTEGAYSDLNGDGKSDVNDRFGAGVITANLTDHLTYDAGNRCTTRDADGVPQLTMNNERMVNFTQMMYSLYNENPGVYVYTPGYTSLHETIPNKFKNDEQLIMFGWFYISDYLRDMEGDYGLIPFPKYDETQDSYLSLVHDISNNYSLPVTCSKVDECCAVLEDMAFNGWKTVAPAYYEVALKTKYVRDSADLPLQIVDDIHDHPTTDFAYVYNYALNGVGLIMRDLMGSKSADFSSKYATLESTAQSKLNDLIALYLEME